jgi:hypothetical protein
MTHSQSKTSVYLISPHTYAREPAWRAAANPASPGAIPGGPVTIIWLPGGIRVAACVLAAAVRSKILLWSLLGPTADSIFMTTFRAGVWPKFLSVTSRSHGPLTRAGFLSGSLSQYQCTPAIVVHCCDGPPDIAAPRNPRLRAWQRPPKIRQFPKVEHHLGRGLRCFVRVGC